ncbi:MAG TPA: glycosylase [Isosphaeraceae bacterium]|jgi:sucrose-6-phosphate hydrolase SacC (GH32 family)|nr:glycosylase [Isosphaeraceae bacterium]
MGCTRSYRFVLFLLILTWRSATAQEFPPELVKWVPAEEKPVFSGTGSDTWDRKIRERGWILIEEDVYHLWYTGYNPDSSDKSMHLGHATSLDGLRWTRDPANPLAEGSWVEDMCVIHLGDTYFMFAEGKGDIAHWLSSPDRVHWTEHGPLDIRKKAGEPISAGPRGTPTVWVEDGTWYLLYERGDLGIWLATSKDRRIWTNVQDDPVIPMGPDSYDREAVAVNQVIKRNGFHYAFYHANSHRPWKDWTTCVARSKDLIHWDKAPANPLIDNNCSSGIVVETPSGLRMYTMHPEVRVFRNPQPKDQ